MLTPQDIEIADAIAEKLFNTCKKNNYRLTPDDVVNALSGYPKNVIQSLAIKTAWSEERKGLEKPFLVYMVNKLKELNGYKDLNISGPLVTLSPDPTLPIYIQKGLLSYIGEAELINNHLPSLKKECLNRLLQGIGELSVETSSFLTKLLNHTDRLSKSNLGNDDLTKKKLIALYTLALDVQKNPTEDLTVVINKWKSHASSDPTLTNDQLISAHRGKGLRKIVNLNHLLLFNVLGKAVNIEVR